MATSTSPRLVLCAAFVCGCQQWWWAAKVRIRMWDPGSACGKCGKCGKCRIQHTHAYTPSQTIPHLTRHGCLDVGSAITTPQECLVGSHHCKWVDLPFPSSTWRYAFAFWAWKGKMQAFQWFHDCILSGNNAMQKRKTAIFGQTSSSTRRVTYFYATMNPSPMAEIKPEYGFFKSTPIISRNFPTCFAHMFNSKNQ